MCRPSRLVQERAGHAQVDEKRAARVEADDQILAAPIDRVDALADELGGNLERIERSRQPRIVDLDLISVRPSSAGAIARRTLSTSGSSGTRLGRRRRAGSTAPAEAVADL